MPLARARRKDSDQTPPTPLEIQRRANEDARRRANRLSHLKQRALRMGLNIHDFYEALDNPPPCEGCGRQTTFGEQSLGTDLTFDHDHVTGRFRGFLCRRCNLVLGQVEDDAGRLRKLADYVDGAHR